MMMLTACNSALIKDRVSKWKPLNYPAFEDAVNFDIHPMSACYNLSIAANSFFDSYHMNIDMLSIVTSFIDYLQNSSMIDDKQLYATMMAKVFSDVDKAFMNDEEALQIEATSGFEINIITLIKQNLLNQIQETHVENIVSLNIKDYCEILQEMYLQVIKYYNDQEKLMNSELELFIKKRMNKSYEACKEDMKTLDESLKFLPFILQPVSTITHLVYRIIAQLESDTNLPQEKFALIIDRIKDMLLSIVEIRFRKTTPFITKWKLLEIVENVSNDLQHYMNESALGTDIAARETNEIMKNRLIEVIRLVIITAYSKQGVYSSFMIMSKLFGKVLPFAHDQVLMQVFNVYYSQNFRGNLTKRIQTDTNMLKTAENRIIFGFIISLYDASLINIEKSDIVVLLKNFRVLSDFDTKTVLGLKTLANILKSEQVFKFEDKKAFFDFIMTAFAEFIKTIDPKDNTPLAVQFDKFVTSKMNFNNIRDYCTYLILKLVNFWVHPKEMNQCTFKKPRKDMKDVVTQIKNMWAELEALDFMEKFVKYVYKHHIDFNIQLESKSTQRQIVIDLIKNDPGVLSLESRKDFNSYDTIVPLFIEILFKTETVRPLKELASVDSSYKSES